MCGMTPCNGTKIRSSGNRPLSTRSGYSPKIINSGVVRGSGSSRPSYNTPKVRMSFGSRKR